MCQIPHFHRMLLGFIARKNDDLSWTAKLACEHAMCQNLADRASATRNQHATAVKRMCLHDLASSGYRASSPSPCRQSYSANKGCDTLWRQGTERHSSSDRKRSCQLARLEYPTPLHHECRRAGHVY